MRLEFSGLSVNFVFDRESDARKFSVSVAEYEAILKYFFAFGWGVKAPHDEPDHDYTGEHGNLRFISSHRGVLSGYFKRD